MIRSTELRVVLLWLAIGLSLFMIYRLILGQDVVERGDLRPVFRRRPPNMEEQVVSLPVAQDKRVKPIAEEELFMAGSQQSKFAYVTLLHGIDSSLNYRGFLYNCILMKQALQRAGSTADFLVLIGFTEGVQPNSETIAADLQLLQDQGLRTIRLPRLKPANMLKWEKKGSKIQFHEMALLKILPWNFTQYERVQYMDGDVLPYRNMDCLFNLSRNSFNTGAASPLNSGWYLAIPNHQDFAALQRLAQWRLALSRWDEARGWGTAIPPDLQYRGLQRPVKRWEFNGASLDQGLCTHYFVLHQGRTQLLDNGVSTIYEANYSHRVVPVEEALDVCGGVKPVDMFYHYTGHNKPWLKDLAASGDKALRHWVEAFENARLNVSLSQLMARKMKSPLGYFYPNK